MPGAADETFLDVSDCHPSRPCNALVGGYVFNYIRRPGFRRTFGIAIPPSRILSRKLIGQSVLLPIRTTIAGYSSAIRVMASRPIAPPRYSRARLLSNNCDFCTIPPIFIGHIGHLTYCVQGVSILPTRSRSVSHYCQIGPDVRWLICVTTCGYTRAIRLSRSRPIR